MRVGHVLSMSTFARPSTVTERKITLPANAEVVHVAVVSEKLVAVVSTGSLGTIICAAIHPGLQPVQIELTQEPVVKRFISGLWSSASKAQGAHKVLAMVAVRRQYIFAVDEEGHMRVWSAEFGHARQLLATHLLQAAPGGLEGARLTVEESPDKVGYLTAIVYHHTRSAAEFEIISVRPPTNSHPEFEFEVNTVIPASSSDHLKDMITAEGRLWTLWNLRQGSCIRAWDMDNSMHDADKRGPVRWKRMYTHAEDLSMCAADAALDSSGERRKASKLSPSLFYSGWILGDGVDGLVDVHMVVTALSRLQSQLKLGPQQLQCLLDQAVAQQLPGVETTTNEDGLLRAEMVVTVEYSVEMEMQSNSDAWDRDSVCDKMWISFLRDMISLARASNVYSGLGRFGTSNQMIIVKQDCLSLPRACSFSESVCLSLNAPTTTTKYTKDIIIPSLPLSGFSPTMQKFLGALKEFVTQGKGQARRLFHSAFEQRALVSSDHETLAFVNCFVLDLDAWSHENLSQDQQRKVEAGIGNCLSGLSDFQADFDALLNQFTPRSSSEESVTGEEQESHRHLFAPMAMCAGFKKAVRGRMDFLLDLLLFVVHVYTTGYQIGPSVAAFLEDECVPRILSLWRTYRICHWFAVVHKEQLGGTKGGIGGLDGLQSLTLESGGKSRGGGESIRNQLFLRTICEKLLASFSPSTSLFSQAIDELISITFIPSERAPTLPTPSPTTLEILVTLLSENEQYGHIRSLFKMLPPFTSVPISLHLPLGKAYLLDEQLDKAESEFMQLIFSPGTYLLETFI